MSYADQVFIQNCKDILSRGVWDTDRTVRPRWEAGTPAHTLKLIGIVNRYDLRKEFGFIAEVGEMVVGPMADAYYQTHEKL